MNKKITKLTIQVPYKRAGNAISQKEVEFDLYYENDHYTLKPCMDDNELQIANLPRELKFVMENGQPVSLRGKKDGNLHIITDAVRLLEQLNKPL